MHRDINFTNLLHTHPSSTDFAVGLLIDFNYAQHIQQNEDASDKKFVTTGTGNSSPNFFNDESSDVLIPSPKVTVSVEILNCLTTSSSSSISASGSPQSADLLDSKDATTKQKGNWRTVSLVFFRW